MASPTDPPVDYAALAARYLELWQEQVAKLGQDPAAFGTYLDAWTKTMGAGANPFFAGLKPHGAAPASPSTDRTAPAAAAHGGGGVDHAALLGRIDVLERRIAQLEASLAAVSDVAKSAAASTRRKPIKAGRSKGP